MLETAIIAKIRLDSSYHVSHKGLLVQTISECRNGGKHHSRHALTGAVQNSSRKVPFECFFVDLCP